MKNNRELSNGERLNVWYINSSHPEAQGMVEFLEKNNIDYELREEGYKS